MNESTQSLEQEITAESELQALATELKDFKQDLNNYLITSQKAVSALSGPIINISMSAEQKSALKASEHTLEGIIEEVCERFGRYL